MRKKEQSEDEKLTAVESKVQAMDTAMQTLYGGDYKPSQMRRLLEKQTEGMTDEEILSYPDFVEKWAAGMDYKAGKRLEYSGIIYKVLADHKSQADWTPDAAPSLYAKVLIPDPDVIPEWEQPESTNPYMTGDKVTHNGKTWVSDIDNNVFEPGVAGWTEA